MEQRVEFWSIRNSWIKNKITNINRIRLNLRINQLYNVSFLSNEWRDEQMWANVTMMCVTLPMGWSISVSDVDGVRSTIQFMETGIVMDLAIRRSCAEPHRLKTLTSVNVRYELRAVITLQTLPPPTAQTEHRKPPKLLLLK